MEQEKYYKKQAIIYVRVSTSMQADEGVSLDAQKAKAKAWAELNDYEIKDIYIDAGISGKRADNRDGLQSALNSCDRDDVLVVYSLSRLARSTKDTIEIGEQLQKSGTDLVSLSEKIDTTTAAGKMVFRMLAVMAEFESDQLSERTKNAMQYKKSKNERIGSIPYGKKLHENGKDLLPNDTELKIIDLIFELKEKGLSLNKIAAHLNKTKHKPRGVKWYTQTIIRVLAA